MSDNEGIRRKRNENLSRPHRQRGLRLTEPGWCDGPLRVSYGRSGTDMLTVIEAGVPYGPFVGSARVELADERFPNLRLCRQLPAGPIVGFSFWPLLRGPRGGLRDALGLLDQEPLFTVPELGLRGASIGRIIHTAQRDLWRPTLDARLLDAARAQTDPETALVLWRQYLEAGEPGAHLRIGNCLLKLDRLGEARHHLWEFVKLAPYTPEGWFFLGRALRWQGRRGQARLALGVARKLHASLDTAAWLGRLIDRDYVQTVYQSWWAAQSPRRLDACPAPPPPIGPGWRQSGCSTPGRCSAGISNAADWRIREGCKGRRRPPRRDRR